MRKSVNLFVFLFFLALSFLFVLPASQAMAGWDCDAITIEYQTRDYAAAGYPQCGVCHVATIKANNSPEIETAGFKIQYDTQELIYGNIYQDACSLTAATHTFETTDEGNGSLHVSMTGEQPVPAGSSGCLVQLWFGKTAPANLDPKIYITELENDLEGLCELPTLCHVNSSPEQEIVYPGDTIQFSAENFYCGSAPGYSWAVDSSIGSSIDADGLYIAGSGSGTDTITVTDNSNGNITDTQTVTVVPCKITLSPEQKSSLPNETIQFSASNTGAGCAEACYTWEVTLQAGSTGGTIDADGLYTAGSDLGTETITVTDTCNSGITAEATVEVIPCKATIDPPNITVSPDQVQEFAASTQGECNATEPSCYTWSVSAEGTTGNTPDNNASRYTWSMNAAEATGNTGNNFIGNPFTYQAGSSEGTEIITVTDTCNGNLSETAVVTIEAATPPPPPPPPPPTIECTSDDDCVNDDLFCNGEVNCRNGKCRSTGDSCPDDGLFCNGEETCDEENDECLSSEDPCTSGMCDEDNDTCIIEIPPECETDTDCDDGLFCNGEETCDPDGLCQPGSGDPCTDDGLFCTGVETCDEGSDTCTSSGDPCTLPDICNETINLCVGSIDPPVDPLSVTLIPNEAFRSHLMPLPLITLMTRTEEDTIFDQTTTVNFGDDSIITPPWTFVLSDDLILIFSMITPAGFEVTGSSDVEVTVTVNEREGNTTLILNTLPFILGDTQ